MSDGVYKLPRTDREWSRLAFQGDLLAPFTRRCFQAAGIGAGMRVLDVGSGVGDVSLVAAELVGPTGSVLGAEIDEESNERARRRAAEKGLRNVEFRTLDVTATELPREFDAIVGRLVLMHLKDPAEVLRGLLPSLRGGGVVAFVEPILFPAYESVPPSPALAELNAVRARVSARAGFVDFRMGLRMCATFARAGLPQPELVSELLIGRADSPLLDYMAETTYSTSRNWIRSGVEGADRIDFDSLAERVRADLGPHGCITLHPLVGAWARLPVTDR
jgi:SAM-dependent methyltransferase